MQFSTMVHRRKSFHLVPHTHAYCICIESERERRDLPVTNPDCLQFQAANCDCRHRRREQEDHWLYDCNLRLFKILNNQKHCNIYIALKGWVVRFLKTQLFPCPSLTRSRFILLWYLTFLLGNFSFQSGNSEMWIYDILTI